MLTDDNIEELKSKGYTVVKNIINEIEIEEYEKEFNNWLNSNLDIYDLHDVIEGYGIFKFYNVGHQRFAWLLRINQKIQEVFNPLKI